ncbi:hypothetical protein [Companilactobacillus metriopterae]|uniref:hypothetical protein n=1 Tax=Companilactobacillus metriopterae TaxID=1909267 RepID=UPI001F50B37C|nr:hypothetical protein [Companilactobacillus metriopterae]
MNNKNLSKNILDQIEAIEQQSNKKINISNDFQEFEFITLDQAIHQTTDSEINITVKNEKYFEFVLSHELHHIMLEISDEPSVSNAVTSGNQGLDGRILSTANSIFESLEHVQVIQDQLEDGTLTDEIKDLYLQGIEKALHPNVDLDENNLHFYQILIMLDGMIFSQHSRDEQWKQDMPEVYGIVAEMLKEIESSDLSKPTEFRRTLINTLDMYDNYITNAGYEGMNYHDFLNITPIVSERQLRLNLNQNYQIKHSVFKNRATGKDGFVLIGTKDEQSVATLNIDPKLVKPEFYQVYYSRTVKDVFEGNGIDYLIR